MCTFSGRLPQMIPILLVSFSELSVPSNAASNSKDQIVNTQCREGSKASVTVYTSLEGGIRSAPISEASHHSNMISRYPPAVEDGTR